MDSREFSSQRYRVVVIGGGVVGCNILYHLALEGWSDLALCERNDLTAGATWHSSGHISCHIARPLLSSYGLYTRSQLCPLEAETGQDVGLRETGSIRLATNSEALDDYKRFANSPIGHETGAAVITPSDALVLWPLMKTDNLVGALHLDSDCYLNAADMTQALAKGARKRGARIFRETEVTGIEQTPQGEWLVKTTRGEIRSEHIVSATGIFARSTFDRFAISMPSAALSHQYLVTEAVEEIRERRRLNLPHLPILRQPDIGFNVREEGEGLFMSLYETNTKPIFTHGPLRDFGMELLPADLEGIEAEFECFFEFQYSVHCSQRFLSQAR